MKDENCLSQEIDNFTMKKQNRILIGGSIVGYALSQALPKLISIEQISVFGWIIVIIVAL